MYFELTFRSASNELINDVDLFKQKINSKSDLTFCGGYLENRAVYNSSDYERLTDYGFEGHPHYYLLVAEYDNQIIGVCFYFIRYSTWKGKVLFLEDFVVLYVFG